MIHLGLINNYTGEINPFRLKFLKKIFKDYQVDYEIIHYLQFREPDILEQLERFDGFISSGSREIFSNPQTVQNRQTQFSFIRENTKPLLGICFGHQMIGAAYGTPVRPMRKDVLQTEWDIVKEMEFSKDFPLLIEGTKYRRKIFVEEYHHEEIIPTEDFLKTFENYASTDSCEIQAIKHRDKLLFGIQFHPDTTKENVMGDARLILQNFISIIKDSR